MLHDKSLGREIYYIVPNEKMQFTVPLVGWLKHFCSLLGELGLKKTKSSMCTCRVEHPQASDMTANSYYLKRYLHLGEQSCVNQALFICTHDGVVQFRGQNDVLEVTSQQEVTSQLSFLFFLGPNF